MDKRLPRGALAVTPPRPRDDGAPGCSFRFPVCVHGKDAGDSRRAEWLAGLETAYERLIDVLGLPPPLDDGAAGGGPGLDLYLTSPGSNLRVEVASIDAATAFDAASAFCAVGVNDASVLRSATLCVAEAILLRVDASETPFSRRALATDLWLTTGRPTSADAAAIDDVQAEPERAVVAGDRSRYAEGSALFLDFLDSAKGRGVPDGVSLAAYALSAGPASPAGTRFVNEPDTLDVLRTTFGPTPSDSARLFADFSIARAFLGTRDRDARFPDLAWVGDFGRVRFEWSVPWSSLPRSLASAHPVEPTGSTYLWVSVDPDAGLQRFVFQADNEPPAAFRWAFALVGSDGRLIRRVDAPFLERETHVVRVIGDLAQVAGIVIAGTNLGGLGPSYPYDPDFGPAEPHGYTVYLAKQ